MKTTSLRNAFTSNLTGGGGKSFWLFTPVFLTGVLVLCGFFAGCKAQQDAASPPAGGPDAPPKLSGISVSPLDMDREFSPDVFEYNVELPAVIEPITLLGIVDEENPNLSVRYYPAETFMPEAGSIAGIWVDDGATGRRTLYVISFSRVPLPAAKLSGVSLTAGTLRQAFDSAQLEYDVDVPFGTASVTVSPEAAQAESLFTFSPSVTMNLSGNPQTDKLTAGVTAENYSTGHYTFTFYIAPALPSTLAGVTLSAGALTDDAGVPQTFDGSVTTKRYITVIDTTTSLVVNAVTENWGDSVRFKSGGSLLANGASWSFSAPLDGNNFQIEVMQGEGHGWQSYPFEIRTVNRAVSKLDSLVFTGGALAQRNADGTNGTTSFNQYYSEYNLSFTHGAASVTINAAAAGKTITIDGGAAQNDSASKTIAQPSALNPPVMITVLGANEVATTYAVYFKKSNPPVAKLNSLSVSGGTLLGTFSAASAGPYTVEIPPMSNAVIINAAADAGFEVTYNPANYALYGGTTANIYVKVSGGADYTDFIYTLNITRITASEPRLSSLNVAGSAVALDTNSIVYTANIPYGAGSAAAVPVIWTFNSSVVSKTSYSLDGGAHWTDDNAQVKSGDIFSLSPNGSKVVLIKAAGMANNDVMYVITIQRESAAQAGLSELAMSGSDCNWTSTSFSPQKTSYNVWLSGDTLTLGTVTAYGGAAVNYTLDGVTTSAKPAVTLSPETPRTLIISVTADGREKSYTLNVTRYDRVKDFAATGSAQTWQAPHAADYKFELWGAQGGNTVQGAQGGKGGYIAASKTFAASEALYLYIGEAGKANSGTSGGAATYGGGGKGGNCWGSYIGGASGGGATFASTVNNNSGISNIDVKNGRVLVAGGGGGGAYGVGTAYGGYGSGTNVAGNGKRHGESNPLVSGADTDSTPTKGIESGTGGIGRNGTNSSCGAEGGGGGGGGYYGGEISTVTGNNSVAGGGGGNGYVAADWTTITRTAGNAAVPLTTGSGTETGHSGAGLVRITSLWSPPAP